MPLKENWQKMEVKQPSLSVILRLMGLDHCPIQQPLQKKARVLSEDYLQRVAFIGVRQKSGERYAFNMTIDDEKECADVFEVVEALNRDNVFRMFDSKRAHSSSLQEEKLFIRQKVMEAKCESVDERLQSSKECQEAREVVCSKAHSLLRYFQKPDCFSKKLNELKAVPCDLQLRQKVPRYCCEQGISFNSNEGCAPSPSSGVKPVRQTSRFSKQVTRKVGNGTNRLGNYTLAKESKLKVTTTDVLSDNKSNLNCLDRSFVASEAQKKTHERWKTSKRVEHFDHSLSSGYMTAQGPYDLVQSMPEKQVSKQEDGSEYFKIQDISEIKSLSSYDSFSEPDENYQPSPDSVLEPAGNEENSFSSEFFNSVSASLIGMQVEVEQSGMSEAYSEGSCVVSGDEDNGKESVGDLDKNEDQMRMFEGKESRDFSYLVDVVTKAGFHKASRAMDLDDSWAISSYVFETLEKKYGEQMMWKRSERRLLFDRINSGLMEMLQPSMGIPAWTKSVGRRFGLRLGEVAIEEELWMILVCQEKKASMDSEKILGKDDKWMNLRDEIQVIEQEIENSLMDELVEDAVRVREESV